MGDGDSEVRPLVDMRTVFVGFLLIHGAYGLVGEDNGSIPKGDPFDETSPEITSHSLTGRHGDSGRPRFTMISPQTSGLMTRNDYDDPSMWGSRYVVFSQGAVGTGLAAGDYNGDGRPDLYVVSKTEPNKLFRQVGDFQFEDVTEEAGVEGGRFWGTGAAFVDIDNDGDLDLYACQYFDANQLYINRGDGTFEERGREFGLDVWSSSVMGYFSDYDRDGDLDVYIVTNSLTLESTLEYSSADPDFLFRNNGDGTFTEVTRQSGVLHNGQGLAAVWWDYDLDGWPDLYVANDNLDPDHLYRNNGDGTFTDILEASLPHTPYFSMGTDFGDIDNDGLLDLFVADMQFTTHYKRKVMMGEMGGPLARQFDRQPVPQNMRNALFLNTGTRRFMEGAYLYGIAHTDWTWSAKFGDLDNDGRLDLHLTNGMIRSFIDADMDKRLRDTTIEEEAQIMKESPVLQERNLAYRNKGSARFEEVSQLWGLNHLGVSFGAVFVDLDRDGDLDIAVNNYQEPVTLYRNDLSEGRGRVLIELRGHASNSRGVGSTITLESGSGRQIRYLSPMRGIFSSDEPLVHFGMGTDPKIERMVVDWPSGHRQEFRDLSPNRRYVVREPEGEAPGTRKVRGEESSPLFEEVSAKYGLNIVMKERDADRYEFARQPLLPYRMSKLGPGLAWGDADGDGREDLFLAGPAGEAGLLLMRGEDGYDKVPFAKEVDAEDMAPLWFDADGDGDDDLFLTRGSVECEEGASVLQDRLYLNDGEGLLQEAPAGAIPASRVSTGPVAAADYDHDGDLDLFVGGRVIPGRYPLSPESALWENRKGRFVDVTEERAPGLRRVGMVTSALWSDANGDGWLDLLVTTEWGPISVFQNTGHGLKNVTAQMGTLAILGWWNSIAGGDIDGDGDIDYVVGNTGLNTKYHASAEKPLLIYYGDFSGGAGTPNLVEAEYENDQLFPVRGKSCSTGAMPFLRERFPSFRSWGAALLNEIYQPQTLASCTRYSINELSSGIFLNSGKGTLEFRPLPRIAQISSVHGLVVEDFDGDGRSDIFMAQNFFQPQVETGRYDGGIGLLLLGQEAGSFDPSPARESGLVISGDAMAATSCDLNEDGWPDLVVSRNSSRCLAFENAMITGRNSFSVSLRGGLGNPRAIGAKITVELKDGRRRSAEIYAGGGYLSQSVPEVFFGYPDGNEPKTITVRWPDGRATRHRWTGHRARIVIETDRSVVSSR